METFSLISIIVPVYKVEKYLPKCIESILSQTYSSFELLLIDDGSPDRCGQICDEYARRDARIRVFHKENEGVSEARNCGLDNAKGDYVTFADSDDWLESDILETLYDLLNKYNVDMSACGLQKEDEDGNILLRVTANDIDVRDRIKMLITLFKGDKYYSCLSWPTNKLYRRSIIEENHIRFDKDIHYNEDRLFIFEYVKYCSATVFSSFPKYHYIIRKDSAMNAFNHQDTYNDKYKTFILAFEKMFQYSCKNYPFCVQQAVASNYALDVVGFYFKFRRTIHQRGMDVELNAIIRKLLPYQTFYERSIYRLFLFYPEAYVFFIKLRYRAYLLKKKLKSVL